MMRAIGRWSVLAGVMLLVTASATSAQVLGTFRWQLSPYCNVVTLTVVAQGASFVLNGFDDQCGAAKQAGASGTAQLNPDNSVGLEFTVIRPDGVAMPAAATINLATLSGEWLDEWSTRNTFVFNPAAPSGDPRPLLLSGSALVQFSATAIMNSANALISFGRSLPFVPTLNILASGSSSANCGGALDPRPLSGHLCFYVFNTTNVGNATGDANRSLASIAVIPASSPGKVTWQARWILNVP